MRIVAILLFIFIASAGQAQEKPKHKVPLLVSHLSEENSLLLHRKGAPQHTIFSRVICFNKKCRGFIGWRNHQQNRRFKGWEDQRTREQKKNAKKMNPILDSIKNPSMPIATVNPILKKPLPTPSSIKLKKEEVFILDDVLFELNSFRLNEEHTFRLDSLVELLHRDTKAIIKINGYTDTSGNERYNLKLSRDRAEAVTIYLIDHAIAEERISFQGLGSTNPLETNGTEEGRKKNRRVEIILIR